MTKEEIKDRVKKHWKEISDDEWLSLYEEIKELDINDEFRNSSEAHSIAIISGTIKLERNLPNQ